MIVGAGFAGSVLAERLAHALDLRVLVVERRPHIGGNAYDRHDDGVLIHPYGPHIFHTNSPTYSTTYRAIRSGGLISTVYLRASTDNWSDSDQSRYGQHAVRAEAELYPEMEQFLESVAEKSTMCGPPKTSSSARWPRSS